MSAMLSGMIGGGMFGFGCCAMLLAWDPDDERTGMVLAALGIAFVCASAWFLGGQ